jgi:3-oxoadipate enol-lactonase
MSNSELYYEESGLEGAPVLMLAPSLGTTLAMWRPALAALERRHRIVRFEHRGHGRSPLPEGPAEIGDLGGDVLALLDRLGLDRVSYVGVSLGGMVGMWLAAHAPERVDRLVCVCSSAYLPPPEVWAVRAASVREARSVAVVADAVLERWFTRAYAEAHPEVMAWMQTMLSECSPEGYAVCCGVIERLDLRGDLPRIAAPTLVIAAAEDPSTPPEHSQTIAAGVPDARLEVLPHGAHLVAIERPDEVTVLIERHLEGAA